MTDNESLRGWLDAAVELAYRAGAEQERAAVVAWLREGNKQTLEWDERENAVSRTYRVCADAIERGEHRREEEE